MLAACEYKKPNKENIRGTYLGVIKEKHEDKIVIWMCTHQHKTAQQALECAETELKIRKLFKVK